MKRKIAMSLLIILVAAVFAVMGTYAFYSDSASSTGNAFDSGTLSISNLPSISSWSASITNMQPGDTRTGTLGIINDGGLPLQYEARVITSGPLFGGAAPATAIISCGATPTGLDVAAAATCTVTVSLPAAAGNSYQGATGAVRVDVEAHQVDSTDPWWGVITPPDIIYYGRNTWSATSTVWKVNANGTGDQLVANGQFPRLSPDKNYIAYRRGNANPLRSNILVRNLSQGTETTFLTNNDWTAWLDWTNDSTKIVFDYACGIYQRNRDGSGNVQLPVYGDCWNDAPAVNRQDGRIAFQNANYPTHKIAVMNGNGTGVSWIPNSDYGIWPAWSPDGQWLSYSVYNSSYMGSFTHIPCYAIYKIKPNGTGKTLLYQLTAPGDQFFEGGAWSTDGTRFFIAGKVNGVQGLYSVPADGSGTITQIAITAGDPPDFVGSVTGG